MKYFAELGLDNIVLRVITVDDSHCIDSNNVTDESLGAQWCRDNLGGTWIMTDDTGSLRKNYAGIGMTYDSTRDAFIPIKEYEDWIFDEQSCKWLPPVPKPTDGQNYEWDNILKNWFVKE